MQWKGPFVVKEVVGQMDYRLDVHGKMKTFHANMLKKFITRPEYVAGVAVVGSDEMERCDEVNHSHELPSLDVDLSGPSVETADNVHICEKLSSSQKKQVKNLLASFSDVLLDQPGRTTLIEHDIQTTSSDPVRVRQYPLPFNKMIEVDQELSKMLKMGVIVATDSPYSAPIVIVKKKDGTNRFCIDYRCLNKVTLFDPEPIPCLEGIFTRLAGKEYYSKFDLTKGYWQVPLSETASLMSAFTVPDLGHFRFTVMPFGLVNAPATFTRLMRIVLKGKEDADNFIDDTILGHTHWEDHLESIRDFLSRLRRSSLTAKPSKCFVGYDSLECFGHEVGNNVQQPHSSKVEVIRNAPVPASKKQVRAFIGLVGFYRKFVPNFAEITLPLTDLTRKGQPTRVQWGEAQNRAFTTLKRVLTGTPNSQTSRYEEIIPCTDRCFRPRVGGRYSYKRKMV
jgi:hypothetical protein